MKNLEQIRASSALHFWNPTSGNPPAARGVNNGDVINGLPSLIMSNGLLATAAFAKAKGGGHEDLLVEVFRFLCDPKRNLLPACPPKKEKDARLDPYIRHLTDGSEATSARLQLATAEALAYLGYLKRFAP